MIREVVKIDEDLCNGCGECVPNCHEGALQIIDGKARLISDLLCDGLGACIGHCPLDAITIEKREAEAYNEVKVMELMVQKGKNTVIAHLLHLKDHNEHEFFKEGIGFLKKNKDSLNFNIDDVMDELKGKPKFQDLHVAGHKHGHAHGQGCPGAREMSFEAEGKTSSPSEENQPSALRQWPVQLHLVNPSAGYFQKSDVLIAADCVAYSLGNFHRDYLQGKSLAIACPKLDSNMDIYIDKIAALIDNAGVNTITVMIMEVPCCSGLLAMVQQAVQQAKRKVPVKATVVGIQGSIIQEEWI